MYRQCLQCCKNFRTYTSVCSEPTQTTTYSAKLIEQEQFVKIPNLSTYAKKINWYFESREDLKKIKSHIPEKYLTVKYKSQPENLYLIDKYIAKDIASRITPALKRYKNNLVCETNAGLGLITEELLKNEIPLVRIYETCSDFRKHLRGLSVLYPKRIELFNKDIFYLPFLSYFDKQDQANRVKNMLKNLHKSDWSADPVMTIIGSMSKLNFIKYLLKSIVFQNEIVTHGRIQLYVLMRPNDFIILTANPQMTLHTYKQTSIMFQLFFKWELLEKYPRFAFVPWEPKKLLRYSRYHNRIDMDLMYLVKITFRKELPLKQEHLLPFYGFIRQVYRTGGQLLIPTIENIVPGCGENILTFGKEGKQEFFEDMGIFTKFGELTPTQILHLFKEVIEHPSYEGSPLAAMIESQLLKSETIETSIADSEISPDREVIDTFQDVL